MVGSLTLGDFSVNGATSRVACVHQGDRVGEILHETVTMPDLVQFHTWGDKELG